MKIAILPGDYIGPEVTGQAQRVLELLRNEGLALTFESAPMGGAGYDAAGDPLPPAILALTSGGQTATWLENAGQPRNSSSGPKCVKASLTRSTARKPPSHRWMRRRLAGRRLHPRVAVRYNSCP